MAVKQDEFGLSCFSSPLQFFEHYFRSVVSRTVEKERKEKEGLRESFLSGAGVNLCMFGALSKSKYSKTSKMCGDLIVKTTLSGKKLETEDMEILQDNLWQCPAIRKLVVSSNVDKYNNIHAYVNRNEFIKNVIEMVIMSGANYGQNDSLRSVYGEVFINCNSNLGKHDSQDEVTIGQLRTVLLCEHMVEILRQNRCHAQIYDSGVGCLCQISQENLTGKDVLLDIGILDFNLWATSLCESKLGEIKNTLKCLLFKSKYKMDSGGRRQTAEFFEEDDGKSLKDISEHIRIKEQSVTGDAIQQDCVLEVEQLANNCSGSLVLSDKSCGTNTEQLNTILQDCGNVRLNMVKYIEDLNESGHGKELHGMYDKNIKEIHVLSVWDDVLHLEMLESQTRIYIEKEDRRKVLHVCGQEKQFHLQKVALTWRSLTERSLAKKQKLLCHGSVVFLNKEDHAKDGVSVGDLLRIRTMQVKHSYFMKYGPIVNDESWRTTIVKMAVAIIKLEILLTPLTSQVKLDVRDCIECPSACRQALFVLYNCARLAKIIEHYNNAVHKEIYPPLPEINEVDFSYLKDEAEWNIFIKYIVSYPDVVRSVGQGLQDTFIGGKFNSNKIAHFLVSLSRDISAYYSRVHILCESRSHLLPLMFARLYLVKAVHQVIQNALQLLGIDSVNQM